MRIPDPIPFGDTSRRAIFLAISLAEPVNVLSGGCVESVVTCRTHFRFAARFLAMLVASLPIGGPANNLNRARCVTDNRSGDTPEEPPFQAGFPM
jgi:hypothetical protein